MVSGSSFCREISATTWFFATSSFIGSKAGSRSTSAKSLSISGKSLVRLESVARPEVSPIEVSIDAARLSSRSSSWSPLRFLVPPVRSTWPVRSASPALAAGSRREPVRMTAEASISGSSWSSRRRTTRPLSSTTRSGTGMRCSGSGGNLS